MDLPRSITCWALAVAALVRWRNAPFCPQPAPPIERKDEESNLNGSYPDGFRDRFVTNYDILPYLHGWYSPALYGLPNPVSLTSPHASNRGQNFSSIIE